MSDKTKIFSLISAARSKIQDTEYKNFHDLIDNIIRADSLLGEAEYLLRELWLEND